MLLNEPVNPLFGVRRIELEKIHISPMGGTREQYLRPFVSQMSADSLDQVVDLAMRTPSVTPESISGIGLNLISPTVEAGPQLAVVGGWDTQRLRVHIRCHGFYTNGERAVFEWSGYTDYVGVSTLGTRPTLDPRMIFVINHSNINNVVDVVNRRTGQSTQMERVLQSGDLLNPNNLANPSAKPFSLRPCDVARYMYQDSLQRSPALNKALGGVIMLDTQIGNAGSWSDTSLHSPTTYISGLLGATKTFAASDGFDNCTQLERMSSALDSNHMTVSDPLLRKLCDAQAMAQGRFHSFEFSHLMNLFPDWQSKLVTTGFHELESGIQLSANDSDPWNVTSQEVYFANGLMQSIVGVLDRHQCLAVSFAANNHQIGGEVVIVPSSAPFFAPTAVIPDMGSKINMLLHDIKTFVLNDLGMRGQRQFTTVATISREGISSVIVNLGRGEYGWTSPTYASAAMAPVQTPYSDHVGVLAGHFSGIYKRIAERVNGDSNILLQSSTSWDSASLSQVQTPQTQVGHTSNDDYDVGLF